jgi:alpha-L-arabinofuranosidase
LSVVTGVIVAVVLLLPIMYSSYWVPMAGDDLEVDLVIREETENPNVTIPAVLGTSIDWPEDAYGLYDPVTGLFNPTPVGELIGLEPSYLRFPAGSLSQNYNWTRGVGNLDERDKNPTHTKYPEPSYFGTDEFNKLAVHTGASPVMVVNYRTGTPAQAREWVSYCNDPSDRRSGRERASNGYPLAWSITDWEIGYEPYLPRVWTGTGSGSIPAGTRYADGVEEYAREMKAIDRSIQVGAWLVLDPEEERYSADENWNQNFINEARVPFYYDDQPTTPYYVYDYVVVKVDLPDIGSLLTYPDLYTYSYAQVLTELSENLRGLRGLLNRLDARPGGVPLAIAFFEPYYGTEGWNTQAPANAASAVMTADMAIQALDIALQDGQQTLKYACFGQLNTPSYSALMINPDFDEAHLDTWQRSPSYYAFQMCSEIQQGRPLRISDLHPIVFEVAPEDELEGYRDVPVLSVIGSHDPDTSTIQLLLVNHDLDRPIQCHLNINLTGLFGKLILMKRVIRFESILDNNLGSVQVTSPLPTTTAARTFTPPVVSVELPPAGVVLVTIKPKPQEVG